MCANARLSASPVADRRRPRAACPRCRAATARPPARSRPAARPRTPARARRPSSRPSEVKKSCSSGRTPLNSGPSLGAVEARRADPDHEQRDRAGARREPRGAGDRRAQHERPVHAAAERREHREQPEPDAERVAAPRPRLDAVDALAGELHEDVDQHQHGERPGLAAGRPAQLADHEREDPRRGGPVAEALGVREHLALREAVRDPARRAADRPPRVEQPEPVAEHQRQERHADPEADVDRRRREVVLLGVRAGEARVDDDRRRSATPIAPHTISTASGRRNSAPLAHRLQPRPRPARGQREEGDDEHGRGGRAEQRLGDREVGPADDAMGDDEHSVSKSTRETTTAPPVGGAVEMLQMWCGLSRSSARRRRPWPWWWPAASGSA